MKLSDQFKDLSHHAYAIISGESTAAELILILEKKHKIKQHGNQDFYNRKYSNFTIDDAREIKSLHSTRPVIEDGKKIFVLQMDNISLEAQNALLKLLEEPAEYAHFFIVIPSAHLLIPTVKSRLQLIMPVGSIEKRVNESDEEINAEVQQFIKALPAKRLELIKSLMDDISKEKKTKQDAVNFINAIQSTVYETKGAKLGDDALRAIEVTRKYMNDRSPSIKMLLEYVALNI